MTCSRGPDFLDGRTDVLPQVRTTVGAGGPALAYLRPYTPEIMGFVDTGEPVLHLRLAGPLRRTRWSSR